MSIKDFSTWWPLIVSQWPLIALIVVIVVGIYARFQFVAVEMLGPKDDIGNGITVGKVKAFDNRSLRLRVERLGDDLGELKVLSDEITKNLSYVQGKFAHNESTLLSLDVIGKSGRNNEESEQKEKTTGKHIVVDSKRPNKEASPKIEHGHTPTEDASVRLAAGDLLSDQLNLASQIMNQETIYERSLTDRLLGADVRLQAVLGLQISITPPSRYKNCAAIVEIGVRMPEVTDNLPDSHPSTNGEVASNRTITKSKISLVALIPNEKTYNAESKATVARSISGSVKRKLFRLSLGESDKSDRLVIHRDPETVAFERTLKSKDPTFGKNFAPETVFGWEFHPVLDSVTVAAGMRQFLAVVALPVKDGPPSEIEQNSTSDQSIVIELKPRTYWRRYNKRLGTTRARWHYFPWKIDGSGAEGGETQSLSVFRTAEIDTALSPAIEKIDWIDTGLNRATVVVKGRNFFSGTRILMAGTTYSEKEKNLTLKSDQHLEFDTTINALSSGEAALSGRFGPLIKLEFPKDKRPSSILITSASTIPYDYFDQCELRVDVTIYSDSTQREFTVERLHQELPSPLFYVGNELIPPPYGYPKNADPKILTVTAWVPSDTLVRNQSTVFQIPFCGVDCKAYKPLTVDQPSIVRLGQSEGKTIFQITHPFSVKGPYTVELDKIYQQGRENELIQLSKTEFRFEPLTEVVSCYGNMIVRANDIPFVLKIPDESEKSIKMAIQLDIRPPRIVQGKCAAVVWCGSGLDLISKVALCETDSPSNERLKTKQNHESSLRFTVFDSDKKVEVYFSETSAKETGKAEVEFESASKETLRAPIYVTSSETDTL